MDDAPNSPTDNAPRTIRKRAIYHGRVQGVGFRATVYDLAADRPVTGFVRNVDDGTVELIVCGREPEVEEFLAAISRRFSRNIAKADIDTATSDEMFSEFEVRR